MDKTPYLCTIMGDTTYNYTYKLEHDQRPAVLDVTTGDIKEIDTKHMTTRDTGASIFNQDASFFKSFSGAWEWLYYRLSPLELKVVVYLAMKAAPITNSLEPLNDDSSVRDLANVVDISKSKITVVFTKLLELGVYGKFEVVEEGKRYMKFWILNPHLAIKSKVIKDGVVKLFQGTELSKAAMTKRE